MNSGQVFNIMLNIAILYNYLQNTSKKYVTYKSRFVLQKAGAFAYVPKVQQSSLIKIITPTINNVYSQIQNLTKSQIKARLNVYIKKYPDYYGFVKNNS
jgi:hypothetical protein